MSKQSLATLLFYGALLFVSPTSASPTTPDNLQELSERGLIASPSSYGGVATSDVQSDAAIVDDDSLNGLLNCIFETTAEQCEPAVQNNDSGECECVAFNKCNSTADEEELVIDIRAFNPCKSLETCCVKSVIIDGGRNVEPSLESTSIECGRRNFDGVGFRITGRTTEAQFGEFPWMVALLIQKGGSDVYQCGGSLIHPQVVMTAAHCVNKLRASELTIRAGEWDTQTTNELLAHQDRRVRRIVLHERFNPKTLYNDVALLMLQDPVYSADNVATVCLPEQDEVFDNERCTASGWGKKDFGKESLYQVILKSVDLPIISRSQCITDFQKTRLGRTFRIHESFICAGGELGKDTCSGDGGGPLVCPYGDDAQHYRQAGIIAWGLGCGTVGVPGAYANVAMFRSWIDQKMVAEGYGVTSYTRLTSSEAKVQKTITFA